MIVHGLLEGVSSTLDSFSPVLVFTVYYFSIAPFCYLIIVLI